MLGVASPALDLSAILQFACTVFAFLYGTLILIRKAASRYFVVDASFQGPEVFQAHNHMPIGGAGDIKVVEETECAACSHSASKKCSRCKRVWYCSEACQRMHWETDHKSKCRKMERSLDKFDINGTGAWRKSATISLVPDHGTRKVLKEPKKILFPYDEFVKLFDWDKPVFSPCGLLNCGNSCFANVVLQCLACTRPLVAYLLDKGHARGCFRKRDDWCFLCELQVHIKRASESSQPFSPINILSRLPNIGGNLGYGRQEDAHEFMRFAIDTMQSICLDEYGGEKVVDPSTQATTIVQYIFGGYLQSQVICTNCNVVSNRYENMMDLTVEIHGGSESLEECLEQFTVKEWLDGENMYKCDRCNGYVKACKRLTVHQAPNVLTITLKRFQSGRFGKLNKRVTFPESLNLTPYMSASGEGSDLYELYGVVVHLDMLNASFFGHYICYIKEYHGIWYKIDDCKVIKVEVEEVLAQGAYMLLYHRKNPRKDPFVKPLDPTSKKNVVEIDSQVQVTQDSSRPLPSAISCLPMDADTQTDIVYSQVMCEVGSNLRDTGHDRHLHDEALNNGELDNGELDNGELDNGELMDVDAHLLTMSTKPVPTFVEGSNNHGFFASPSGENGVKSQNCIKSMPLEHASIRVSFSSAQVEATDMDEGNKSANVQAVPGPIMEKTSTEPRKCVNGTCPFDTSLELKRSADSMTNLKPIFTRGFLDRPVQMKAINKAKTVQLEKKTANGYSSNYHFELGSNNGIANENDVKFDTASVNGPISLSSPSFSNICHMRHDSMDCHGV